MDLEQAGPAGAANREHGPKEIPKETNRGVGMMVVKGCKSLRSELTWESWSLEMLSKRMDMDVLDKAGGKEQRKKRT